MAIALVNNSRGLTIQAAAGPDEPIDLPAGASIALGNHLILVMTYDNSGFSGGDPGANVLDPRGNLWTRLVKSVYDPAGADAGVIVDVWISRTQIAYTNGDDVTVTFGFTESSFIGRISEWSGIRPITYPIVPASTSVTAAGTSTTAVTGTPTIVGQLVIGAVGLENNTAITGDADVTGGAWVLFADDGVGAGATGLKNYAQYKIVTTTAGQNYVVTMAASDAASALVVLDVFVPVANPNVSGNPNYPCIAGFEGLPTETASVAVDTGTSYLFTHVIPPNDFGTQDYVIGAEFLKPDETSQHSVIYDLYQAGGELAQDEITTVVLPVNLALKFPGAVNVLADLQTPGDSGVVLNGSISDYIQVTFNSSILTANYLNARVLRFGVRYLAWKDDGAPGNPGEGFLGQWEDSILSGIPGSVLVTHGAWLVPNYRRDVTYETRWFGEVNFSPPGLAYPALAADFNQGSGFTVRDLTRMGATTSLYLVAQQGDDLLQTNVTFDFVEMVVELAPERRIGNGTRTVSNAYYAGNLFPFSFDATQMLAALNTSNKMNVSGVPNSYVLAVREALPASPSDYYRAQKDGPNLLSRAEAAGPSLRLLGYTTPRATLEPLPTLRRGTVSGGVFAADPVDFDQYTLSVVGYDAGNFGTEGSFWTAYRGVAPEGFGQVYAGHEEGQFVVVSGTNTFDRIKVLVKPDPLTTANLVISVEKPISTVLTTATISVATALAAPDVGNGYREVSLPLAGSITPTSGQLFLRFQSAASTAAAPWRVAAGNPDGNSITTGYNYAAPATAPSNVNDYAAVLQCTLALPTYTITTSAPFTVDRGETRCVGTEQVWPVITLTNGALYDWVSVERSLDGGSSYMPVVLVSDPANAQAVSDLDVPWDLPVSTISYRLIGYRNIDRRSVTTLTTAWNATAPAAGAAFGLSSTENNVYAAYVPASESALDITWNPLNPISSIPLHGVDYQVALRAPEERGLSVSVGVVVDHILACDGTLDEDFAPEVVARGAKSMTPLPFDGLRALEGYQRLTLKLPGGHTRFVSLDLGGMSVRTAVGVYMAELTLTDATTPEVDPYS